MLTGSSDPIFQGNPEYYTPEEMFLASLSSCHMLWYLHLCADAGIIVTAYRDHANGELTIEKDGNGKFSNVTLRPHVTVSDPEHEGKAMQLHTEANRYCFIANSCNFPINHEAECISLPSK